MIRPGLERVDDSPIREPSGSDREPGEPAPGEILEERYKVIGELGSGGMGIVYRAEHLRLRRQVAIKMLRQPFSGAQDLRPRFEREARALAALSHPNIVAVTDYGVHSGRPFLVMELVEGRTLRTVIDEGGVVIDRAVDIARQLLEGVAFAHRRGLVHRDIKPGNVLLQPLESGRELVKILDFGFAKFLEGESEHGATGLATLTKSAIGFGTPAYIPPEQATGGTTDARTDVYSLGVVLFELLTGKQPFEGEIGELVHKHLVEPPPRLAEVRPDVPFNPALQEIIDKAMAKKQVDRYDDASEMLAALRLVHEPSGLMELPTEPVEPLPSPIDAHAPTLRPPSTSGSELGLPSLRATPKSKGRGPARYGLWLAGAMVIAIGAGVYLAQPDDVEEGQEMLVRAANQAATKLRDRERANAERVVAERAPAAETVDEESASEEATAEEGAPEETATAAVEEATTEGAGAEEEAAIAEAEAAAEAAAPAERTSADPWEATPVPRELARLRRRVYGRGQISATLLRQLRQYARENRGDPRPSLLLGDAYLRKGWSQDALERYELAYTLSPDSRNDPRMLRNIVQIIATVPVMAPKASEALTRMYGAEARQAVYDAARAPDLDVEARRRLRALYRQLPRR